MSFSMLIGSIEKNPGQINLENYTLNLLGDSALLGTPKAQWALCKDKGKNLFLSFQQIDGSPLPSQASLLLADFKPPDHGGAGGAGGFLLIWSLSKQLS